MAGSINVHGSIFVQVWVWSKKVAPYPLTILLSLLTFTTTYYLITSFQHLISTGQCANAIAYLKFVHHEEKGSYNCPKEGARSNKGGCCWYVSIYSPFISSSLLSQLPEHTNAMLITLHCTKLPRFLNSPRFRIPTIPKLP